ncbi:feruloyl esterase [Comamonas sp. BIGb0124]|uniref:tannase/feruloyl esterase family alpha/beta hydrolase n=1 Tax=Comamonas sp. BIGb0124 TaxID=2485130 RepID=UPI000FBEA222|nr:tannase/feruloyl esterase family alpha/beta hydrolase [Comamonas sp. BIGb0124]ROR25090.1 feruloyl esterase [Comamonas sp. BIGb0124]
MLAVSLATLLSACGGSDKTDAAESSGNEPSPSFAQTCSALVGTAVAGGVVTQATMTAASEGTVSAASWPSHCLVRGVMNQRTGIDNKPYALQFELRLPEASAWNSRFYYQGGSGVDGTLFTALGSYSGGGNERNALLDGYAVVTTDSGHIAETGVANGSFLFGADPQARDEYGDMQIPQVTAAAQTLMVKAYGSAPQHSYFVGCSNGGRQAMIAAQKYPDLFDGIVAAAPGFRLTQASIQGSIYQIQRTAQIAPKKADGSPDITLGLTASEKTVVADRILGACDALDGLADGMVNRLSACRPDPLEWVCKTGETEGCLSQDKAQYVKDIFEGPSTRSGERIYASWPYDPAMVSQFSNPFYSIFAGEASHIYTSPPTLTADLLQYALTADMDTEFRKLSATTTTFKRSGNDFTNAESPDMDAFKKRGGKLIIFNGGGDTAFSMNDVTAYYDKVSTRYGGVSQAQDFVRAFYVPGMSHCSGGAGSTDQFDAFGAVRKWAEDGVAPDAMVATARAAAGSANPGRTRPLCPYPAEAIYNGTGDPEVASSFSCKVPAASL